MCWYHRFLRDETGAMTIEFVLWIPVIVALLTVVIDATTLYITHTEMWNVARDTARRMVSGRITTLDEARNCAAAAMSLRDFPYYVDAAYDKDTGAEVLIAIKVNDMAIIGYSPLSILGGNMVAHVIMRPDPDLEFGTVSKSDCEVADGGGGGGNGGGGGGGNGNGGGGGGNGGGKGGGKG